ncbi:hypothetical protein BDR04DRAFT_1022796, partial [Suillus decipiens]
VDLDFICKHAKGIPESSSISYLNVAQPNGMLFQENCNNRVVSCVFTKVYVDHAEPLVVLEKYKNKDSWCLGKLLNGHEFLTIFPIAPVSPIMPMGQIN